MFDENTVQVHVSLSQLHLPVWRSFEIPLGHNLRLLHQIIQAGFGWHESHLHQFGIGGLRFGESHLLMEMSFAEDARVFEETEVTLRDFDWQPGTSFTYTYDFGDDWVHRIELEKRLVSEALPRTARCIAGAGACPPEDVGGPPGYANFLEIMADKTHEEYADTRRWYGGDFDPAWFDLELCNKDLATAFRANRRRRMRQPQPKQK